MPHISGPEISIFTGGGWQLADGARSLALRDPVRVLTAGTASEIPGLLQQVELEQRRGRYVAGYLAYEAGEAFGLAVKPHSDATVAANTQSSPVDVPLAWMAVYPRENATTVDQARPAGAVCLPDRSSFRFSQDRDGYLSAIERIHSLIAAGDTYQVNYTLQTAFDLNADPLDYFLARTVNHPVPYGAYLDLGDAQVISISPELFLRRRGDLLESRPMKGTRPRGATRAEDAALARALFEAEKDRAENLMIVDMVRNDLGRVSRPGSVSVPSLYAVEPYGTVWQMTSTVTGSLQTGAGLTDILAATFPGASVTGAPKHHTMEITRDLEVARRGVYTGMVGLFLPDGDFTCNLAIRTLVHRSGHCSLGVGSGIVWDSNPEEEYRETLDKLAFVTKDDCRPPEAGWPQPAEASQPRTAEASLGLFETVLLEAGGKYRWLPEHLDRMALSAASLGLPFDRDRAESVMRQAGAEAAGASAVIRLDLDFGGRVSTSLRPVPESPTCPLVATISAIRVDPAERLLMHKTTQRYLYDQERKWASEQGFFEVLFVNVFDHVTEGSITNIFARFGRSWVTPPVSDGLLPGIWRAKFMAETQAKERSLGLSDLARADELILGNSVRGPMRLTEIKDRTRPRSRRAFLG